MKKTKSPKDTLKEEIQEIEQWIMERKKFFKKLTLTIAFITLLIIVSEVYLKIQT